MSEGERERGGRERGREGGRERGREKKNRHTHTLRQTKSYEDPSNTHALLYTGLHYTRNRLKVLSITSPMPATRAWF